jgi:hypothetical protein
MYFGEKYTTPDVKLLATAPALDPRIAGSSYLLEGFPYPFKIEVRNGRPIVEWNEIRQEAMLPVAANQWFLPLDWAILTLRLDDAGKLVEGTMTAPWSAKEMKVTAAKAPG